MVMSYSKSRASHTAYFVAEDGLVCEAGALPPRWYVSGGPTCEEDLWTVRFGVRWQSAADTTTFERLARGWHPSDDRPLSRNHAHPRRVAMHDFTFSAPKSVSVAWALGDEDTAQLIATAHEAAVDKGLEALTSAARSRLGAAGVKHVPVKVLGALFVHGASRTNDPQLHTHAVIMNVAQVPDGGAAALEARGMLEQQGVAGCIYALELADQLARAGFDIIPTHDGHLFEVAEVPVHVREVFSTRQRQVRNELETCRTRAKHVQNTSTPTRAQRQRAVLVSRSAKEVLPLGTLRKRWQAHALGLSFAMPSVHPRDVSVPVKQDGDNEAELLRMLVAHLAAKFRKQKSVSTAKLKVEACAALMGLCGASRMLELLAKLDMPFQTEREPTSTMTDAVRDAANHRTNSVNADEGERLHPRPSPC